MSGPYREPRPGVFVLRGNETRVFKQGSMIKYDKGLVIIQVAVPAEASGPPGYQFAPVAWFKLEEGMLVSFANAPRPLDRAPVGRPYALRGGSYFDFGRSRPQPIEDGNDVVKLMDRAVPLNEDAGWPQEQIFHLLRLGPDVIFVDSSDERPMEVAVVESKVPLVSP